MISNSVNLIIKNGLAFDDSFPILLERNYEELSFINNKRATSNNYNKQIKNYKHFNKNLFNIDKNENLNNLNNNKIIFKISKDFSKIKYHNQGNYSKIDENKNYKNDNKYLHKIEKTNNIFINKSNSKLNKVNNSTVIKDNNEDMNNNNNSQKEMNSKNNLKNLGNEIKVKKNNKMIYINSLLFKPKNTNKDMILQKKKRSSLYRGVSKNGNKWQVIISSKYKKAYVGLYNTQEIAARIYDFISIKNKGIKAKTNFVYNLHQIQTISDSNIDYKAENIEEIISHLIKE